MYLSKKAEKLRISQQRWGVQDRGSWPASKEQSFISVWAELLQVNYERNIPSGLQVSLQTGTAR